MAVELGESSHHYRDRYRDAFHHLRLRLCPYALPGKATLLKGMLIFQMFPAVLSLVALYALFDRPASTFRLLV